MNRRDDAPAFSRHHPPPHVFGPATKVVNNEATKNHDSTTVSHDVSVMTSPADFEPRRDVGDQVQGHEQMDDSPALEGAVGGAPAPDRSSQVQNVDVGEGVNRGVGRVFCGL